MSALQRARWLILIAAATLGCSKLNNGRCDTTSDCMNTQMHCETDTKKCVLNTDGGAGGVGGMAGSMGGAAGGKPASRCADPCPATTPICDMDAGAGACKPCSTSEACAKMDTTTPVCAPSPDGAAGPPKGTCVGCINSSQCAGGAKPICDTNTWACAGCESSDACKGLNPLTPVCVKATDAAAGPKIGMCVGCLTNANCGGTTPICNLSTNVCMACVSDADCGAVSPSICMTDGHCATDAETIYVQNDTSICNDNPSVSDGGTNAGTKAHPFCSMPPILTYVSMNRDLVLVEVSTKTITGGGWIYADQARPHQLSIVGQQGATIGTVSDSVFSMQSGSVYIRGVKFSPSASIGIQATGGTLSLNGVTVNLCMGGGLALSSTTFDIENTTVTNNGPGPSGTSGGVNISTAGSGSKLNLVTIENNTPIGITCDTGNGITTTGVYVMMNTGSQIANNCGFSSCAQLGGACGAP